MIYFSAVEMMKEKEESSASDDGKDDESASAIRPDTSMISLKENLESLAQLQKVHEEVSFTIFHKCFEYDELLGTRRNFVKKECNNEMLCNFIT